MLRRLFVSPLVLFVWPAVAALVLVPLVAQAQDTAALTLILNALPERIALPLLGLWFFGFYFVGPLLKRSSHPGVAKLGEVITQDTYRPPRAPGAPSSSTVTKIGGAALLLALAGPALAQETPPAPAFGGAFTVPRLGLVTVGPSAAVSLGAYELRSGVYSQGWKLAPGYGIAAWSDRWYTVGLSAALLYAPGSEETPARAAASLSFAKYLRVMYGYGGRVLLAVGVGP